MDRPRSLEALERAFSVHPVVAILGPRQCGKTTLARQFVERQGRGVSFFDLEDVTDLARLETPKLALQDLKGLVVIDEIQRRPELFPTLRVLVDRPKAATKFLILGSASRDLIRQSSESLAGRISYLELSPFSVSEVGQVDQLWLRGGFPRSFLADTEEQSADWRRGYISTYLERDIPQLGIGVPAAALRRFWMMLAHYHGQVFNASEIGKSLGVSDKTARHYLDILSGTFMVRQLQPWYENMKKRQVKGMKVYFRDSGIFHSLLGIENPEALARHPKLGASWEGFALEEVIRSLEIPMEEVFFWGVHGGGELDLLVVSKGRRLGFEIKYTDAPRITPSVRKASEALKLDEMTVVFPGSTEMDLGEGVRAKGLELFQ